MLAFLVHVLTVLTYGKKKNKYVLFYEGQHLPDGPMRVYEDEAAQFQGIGVKGDYESLPRNISISFQTKGKMTGRCCYLNKDKEVLCHTFLQQYCAEHVVNTTNALRWN